MRDEAIKVRMTSHDLCQIKAIAQVRGQTVSTVIRDAIVLYLAKAEENCPPALRQQIRDAILEALRSRRGGR